MLCINCNNQLNSDEKFCKSCGKSVTEQILVEKKEPAYQASQNASSGTENGMNGNPNLNNSFQINSNQVYSNNNIGKNGKISKVIGIVSIILVFIFQVLIIPLAVTGLILGLKHKKQTGSNSIGIVLNSISIIIAVPIYIFYSSWLLNPINPVLGTWNCKEFDGSGEGDDYIVTMKLNRDSTFIWSKYGDGKDNYVKGSFEFKDLEKSNEAGEYFYYSITLIGEKFVSDGEVQTQIYKSKYEMGVGSSLSKTNGSAILMNTSTYNMYYCYLEK